MKSINPSEIATGELHQYILGCVAPRPIAFVSTVSKDGTPNLAPFSFFNAFSSNPPTLIFSPNRRVRGNTTKDTLHNVEATGEAVVNIVDYSMVRQMAVASIEYPTDVNEFEKSGLTPVSSEMVVPPRVGESPMQFECKVRDIIKLGEEGGAGNLVLCEPVRIHLADHIFNDDGKIDPRKTDQVARMGRAYYCRVITESFFSIFQPVHVMGMGFDALPESVKSSRVLTGNDLGMLAGAEQMPGKQLIADVQQKANQDSNLSLLRGDDRVQEIHRRAQLLLGAGKVEEAWCWMLVE